MLNSPRTTGAGSRESPSRWLGRAAGIVLLACAMNTVAQAPAAAGGAAPPQSSEALDKLVGPIALYPDDLVAIILPASTNPLQLVQADRYLDKRKADPKLPVDDKWDDAVKSLLNYPDVVKIDERRPRLDERAGRGGRRPTRARCWMRSRAFRRRAQAAGNLKSDGKQVVAAEQEVITIVPADPQVIYVPQYNPTTVVVYGCAVLGLLPDPVSVVLLPVCARCGARGRRDLGRGDRRGLERRPLRFALRRGRQHQHQSQHEHQHRQYQQRQRQPARRSRRRHSRGSRTSNRGRSASRSARRRRRRAWAMRVPAEQALHRQVAERVRRRSRPAAAGRRRKCARRGVSQRVATRQLWRERQPWRSRGRRRLRRLRLRTADADGQFSRRVEPQFDVRRRRVEPQFHVRRRRVAFDVAAVARAAAAVAAAGAAAAVGDGRRLLHALIPAIDSKALPMNITRLWYNLRRFALVAAARPLRSRPSRLRRRHSRRPKRPSMR